MLGGAAARRERIEELPVHLRPVDLDEAYQVQSALIGQSKEEILGLKIAATSRAGQAHIGIDHPISGQLMSSQVVMPGDTADMHGNLMQAAEAEFVFEFTSAVMPRAEPYSWQEVMTYVGHLRLGIEIPDSRYRNFSSVGATQLIADNACAYLFVLGPRVQAEWRVDDLVIWDNRQVMHRGRRYRHTQEVRDLRRATLRDDGPTVEQVGAASCKWAGCIARGA